MQYFLPANIIVFRQHGAAVLLAFNILRKFIFEKTSSFLLKFEIFFGETYMHLLAFTFGFLGCVSTCRIR